MLGETMKPARIPIATGAVLLLVHLVPTSAMATIGAAPTGPEIQTDDVYSFYKL
jgi:hypothetical protein